MEIQKPKNIEEYKEWVQGEFACSLTSKEQTYHESITDKICKDFKESEYWKSLGEKLKVYNQEYYLKTGFNLFIEDNLPELVVKPFDSLLLKSFRKNVINNSAWPNEPKGGWYLPSNWYEKTNDIIRTLFTVKYMDGVHFMSDKLEKHCDEKNFKFRVDYEAKEEGYYAAHSYVFYNAEVPDRQWDTLNIEISIELQITTQVQEVIRKLLHKYYEDKREKIEVNNAKWQWDYKSDEFSANYLGHILHYLEGMILDVRDKQKED